MYVFCHERGLSSNPPTPITFYPLSACACIHLYWRCLCCCTVFHSRLIFCSEAKVIIACRDMGKAEAAVKEIIESSGNQNVLCMKLDLADSKSITEFAEAINKGKPWENCTHEGTWKPQHFLNSWWFSKLKPLPTCGEIRFLVYLQKCMETSIKD